MDKLDEIKTDKLNEKNKLDQKDQLTENIRWMRWIFCDEMANFGPIKIWFYAWLKSGMECNCETILGQYDKLYVLGT